MKKEKYLFAAIAMLVSLSAFADDFYQVRTTPGGVAVHINSNMPQQVGLTIGTTTKTGTQEAGGGGCIKWFTDDAPVPPAPEGYLQGNACLMPDPDPAHRRLKVEAIEQGTAYRNVTLSEHGGNVCIGSETCDIQTQITTAPNPNGYTEAMRIEGQTLSNDWERGIAFTGNGGLHVGTIAAYLTGLDRVVRIYAGGNLVFQVRNDGAVIVGNPSGGFMGPGTLNVGGQIYRNGVPVP